MSDFFIESSLLNRKHLGKPIGQHLREFGLLFSLIGIVVSAYLQLVGLYNDLVPTLALVGAGFGLVALYIPIFLYPLWKLWMGFGNIMGSIVTTLLLALLWALIMIPTAILLRILRKQVVNLTFDKSITSYWEDRDLKSNDFRLMDKMF